MTTPPGVIELRDVRKSFDELQVLAGIDLSIRRGEVVVVMGRSGSGKTTLIRCMNLLEEPESGTVRVCNCTVECAGRRRSRDRDHAIRDIRLRTAMVFQQFNLFPHMTALGNVIEGPVSVRRRSRDEALALGERLLAQVGLADKRDEYPSRLSGGQKQRVAIARALAMEPEVILFDEPTSALDPELHGEVLQVIRELAQKGMTMVIVTHEVQFARDVADRVVFMDAGKVLEDASTTTFFASPTHPRVRSFLRLVDDSSGPRQPTRVRHTPAPWRRVEPGR